MIDVDALLEPRSDDAPSGEDMEYDAEFIAMELASQPGEERQVGDSIIEAEEPDFDEMITTALAVLERSHDLRGAVRLGYAVLRRDGFAEFAEVLRYVHGCLERHWETCHPQLDAEDDNDPTMRVNAVLGFTDTDTVLRALRLAPLTNSRVMGRFTLRDILVLEDEIPQPADMEQIPDAATVRAAFEDTDTDWLEQLRSASAASREHLKGIGAVFDDRVGALGPDLSALERMLFQIAKVLADYAPAGGGEADAGAEDGGEEVGDIGGGGVAAAGAGGSARAVGGAPGSIGSPTDVIRALDKICDYYAKNEPSSPVPILLNRAKRLVSADFMTIVKDLAPLGMENVQLIGGIEEEIDSGDEYQ